MDGRIVCLVLLVVSIFVTGCGSSDAGVQEQPPTQDASEDSPSESTDQPESEELRDSDVEYIGRFMAQSDEDVIEFSFSLLNKKEEYVAADGVATITIENNNDEVVYAGEIRPKKEDFGMYTMLLTDEHFMAYVWELPVTAIDKSTSSSGTAYIVFQTRDAVFEEIDTDIWGLPTYSEEELEELNEETYLANSIDVNKKLRKGSFEVTVLSVGVFTPLVEYGDQKTYFRVDMEAKNIGDEKEYFSPSGLALIDNQGNQYDEEYGGTLDTYGDMYPNIIRKGYVLFEEVPANTQNLKLLFELGYDEDFDQYLFEYIIPLATQ